MILFKWNSCSRNEYGTCPLCNGSGQNKSSITLLNEKCHYCNGGKTVLTGVVEFRTYPHQIEFGIEKEKRIHDLESILLVINECIEENICTIYEDSILHNQIRDFLDI